MTPAELIEYAATLVERPDLADLDNPMILNSLRQALYTAHGLDKFVQDMTQLSLEDYPELQLTGSSHQVTLTKPPRWRKLDSLSILGESGCILVDSSRFKQAQLGRRTKNYFGFTAQFTYMEVGQQLTVQWPAMSGQQLLCVGYYKFPTLELTEGGQWISDSFILAEFPFVVLAELLRILSIAVRQQEDLRHFSMMAAEQSFALISQYAVTQTEDELR